MIGFILVPTKDFVAMQNKVRLENNTKGIEAAFFII